MRHFEIPTWFAHMSSGNVERSAIDALFADLERATRTAIDSRKYPPTNIIKTLDDARVVEMAVAGFEKDDLSVVTDRKQLIITGKLPKPSDVEYMTRGIARRNFETTVELRDYEEVRNIILKNGMLRIELVLNVPEQAKPVTHNIVS